MKKTKKQIQKDIKRAWIVGIVVLALTLVLEFFMHPHSNFGIDGTIWFHAWFGFGACLLIIVVAKALGFLKRGEDYYQGDEKC